MLLAILVLPALAQEDPVSVLRTIPAFVRPGGQVLPCRSGVRAVDDLLGRIEGAVLYMEYDAALLAADQLPSALACARELVEGPAVARGWLYSGFAAQQSGEMEVALVYYARAVATDPLLEWDEALGFGGETALEGLKSELRSLPVEVYPLGQASRVWIDGRPAAHVVRPGLHVVQIDGEGWTTLAVEASESLRVVLPGELDPVEAVGSPEGRQALSEIVLRAPLSEPILFPDSTGLWTLDPMTARWSRLDHPVRKPKWRFATLSVGAAALVGGGTLALTARESWFDADRDRAKATPVTDWDAIVQRQDAAATRYYTGLAVAVSGSGLVAFSMALPRRSRR